MTGSATTEAGGRPRRSGDVGLVAALLVAAVVGWALSYGQMAGMDSGPGTELGGLGAFTLVWVTMMVAMMLPPLVPMVSAYGSACNGGRNGRRPLTTAAFVAGYLVPWCAVGLVMYLLVEGVRSLHVDALAWGQAGRYLVAGVILGAALYQLTPVKELSLRQCRDPSTMLERRRPGVLGAVRTGGEHGSVCVACCWAMMAALFALGVMSIGWMALVALLIAGEKLLPWKAWAKGGVAVVLALLATAVALAPAAVPGLKVPGSTKMPPTTGAWSDQAERTPRSAGRA